jgi:hypothetical protein
VTILTILPTRLFGLQTPTKAHFSREIDANGGSSPGRRHPTRQRSTLRLLTIRGFDRVGVVAGMGHPKTKKLIEGTHSPYMTTDEVAVLLRTSAAAVRLMVYRGQLPRSLLIRPTGGQRTRMLFERAALLKHLSKARGTELTGGGAQ